MNTKNKTCERCKALESSSNRVYTTGLPTVNICVQCLNEAWAAFRAWRIDGIKFKEFIARYNGRNSGD